MKKLFIKLFFASLPILLLMAFYVATDPFKSIFTYKHYQDRDGVLHVTINNEVSNINMLENNYPKYHYNSFILGSSRSRNVQVANWLPYIQSNNGFHFDASNETLYGVERKFNYLQNKGIPIKHVLWFADASLLQETENLDGQIFRKSPKLSGENWLYFQIGNFIDFLDFQFIKAFISYTITKKVTPEMEAKELLTNNQYHYEELFNEETHPQLEAAILHNPDSFYNLKKEIFYTRPTNEVTGEKVIGAKQMELLKHIQEIVKAQNCDLQIIINPLYNQIKLNPEDIKSLQNLFGKDRIHDFSGINAYTNEVHNYYETSHFRPHVANALLKEVYRQP